MRLGIIGHQSITKFLIDQLTANGHDVTNIVCTNQASASSVVDHFLFEQGQTSARIYYVSSYSLKSDRDREVISRFAVDAYIVFGWSRLIPPWLVLGEQPVLGMHGGMLAPPRCRGRAVFNWALIGGYESFYLYVMELDEGVDTGTILSMDQIVLTVHDDIQTVYLKYALSAAEQIISVLKRWPDIHRDRPLIADTIPSYLPKRTLEDGYLNLSRSRVAIYNLVRALRSPFPGAFVRAGSAVVHAEDVIPFSSDCPVSRPVGTILNVFPNGMFSVRCGDGAVLFRRWHATGDWQPEEGIVLEWSRENQLQFPEI